MALSDPGGNSRKIIWYDMPVPLTLGGTVYAGDLVGYSAGWVQADADGGIEALFVAVESGVSTDVITVARIAVVDGYSGGTAGNVVYASDTAGSVSETTSTQKVGRMLTTELALIQPEKYIEGGSWSAPILSTAAGETFRELWAKCSGAGHVYGERVNVQITNDASTSSNAIRAESDFYHTSGHVAGGGSAVHAAADLGATNTGVAGMLAGVNAAVITAADTRSLNGTFTCISLQTEFKAGNTMPAATTSFIRMADAGAVKSPLLWDTAGIASASDGAWETDAGAVGGTVLGYYKVYTAAGAGYLVVYSSHS